MAGTHDTEAGKKTIQINVKMSEQDHELILQAAARFWPNAILSKSAMVLGLARMRARQALGRKQRDQC
jgi:hypothetical protein